MHKHSTYSLILSALLTLPILSACVSEGLEPCPAEVAESAPGYLRLAVSTSANASSRANPTGGEEGDGREHGGRNENTIHNLTIFLYQDGGEGLDGDYEIQWSKYIKPLTDDDIEVDMVTDDRNPASPYDRIFDVRIPLKEEDLLSFRKSSNKTLRLLVIANAGDLTDQFARHTINEICKEVSYGNADAWKDNDQIPGNADYFVMSPAFNGAKRNDNKKNDGVTTMTSSSDGTIYSAEVTLERVAARIDLRLKTTNIIDGKVVYTVDEERAYTGGKEHNTLTILNAIPVNLMQKHSYLVKQVTSDLTTTGTLLTAADEKMDVNGVPTNYVITPDFSNKPYNQNLSDLYGPTTSASNLRNLYQTGFENLYPLNSEIVGEAFQFEGANENERAIILTYANENTHPQNIQVTTTDNGVTTHPSDYLTGLLFRTQYHPATLHTDGNLDGATAEYEDGDDFWLFRTVSTEVKEATNIYFASQEALDAYVATLPAGGKYETVKYANGICYYNVWIRHANIDDNSDIPMKYGIVRNNIYRVQLVFHGIGQPRPEIREPYAVTPRIYVIKWNFRPQPEIVM